MPNYRRILHYKLKHFLSSILSIVNRKKKKIKDPNFYIVSQSLRNKFSCSCYSGDDKVLASICGQGLSRTFEKESQ